MEVREGSVVVAFVSTLIAVAVAGAAVTARLVAADRRQREYRIRLEQRVRLARDLHDYVAHHVTGIVVQAQGPPSPTSGPSSCRPPCGASRTPARRRSCPCAVWSAR
ncbi:histidine kinase [Streptomyces nogalater]